METINTRKNIFLKGKCFAVDGPFEFLILAKDDPFLLFSGTNKRVIK